jgi:hypothetical protein
MEDDAPFSPLSAIDDAWTEMQDLRTKLTMRGFRDVDVSVTLRPEGYSPLRLEVDYRVAEGMEKTYQVFRGEPLDDGSLVTVALGRMFREAHEHVDGLKSRDALEYEAFIAQVGRLMDRARDLGVPVELSNPLADMMRALATNALEDRRS